MADKVERHLTCTNALSARCPISVSSSNAKFARSSSADSTAPACTSHCGVVPGGRSASVSHRFAKLTTRRRVAAASSLVNSVSPPPPGDFTEQPLVGSAIVSASMLNVWSRPSSRGCVSPSARTVVHLRMTTSGGPLASRRKRFAPACCSSSPPLPMLCRLRRSWESAAGGNRSKSGAIARSSSTYGTVRSGTSARPDGQSLSIT